MTHRWLVGTGVVLALAVALALIAAGGGTSLAEDGIIYVDVDAPAPGDGEDWTTAFTDLQDALDAAADVAPVQIWVAEGTYKPPEEHGGSGDRYKSFQMANDVAIYGGFAGTETELGQRNWEVNETILSGDIGNPGDDSDNSYHVFYHPGGTGLDSTAILDGFTVSGGNADSDWPHNAGGGMYNYSSSPALTNCTFNGNSAYGGGGMENMYSSPTLTNCTFSGSSATLGGGMRNWYSSPTLTNCTFTGNQAGFGGGIYNYDSSAPTLTNCTFSGNSAWTGGGIYNYASSPTLTNCILWGDGPGEIHNQDPDSTPAVTYGDIQGGYGGEGNINEDPLFLDAAGGDLRLQLTSPAIDAGDNGAVPAAITTDLDGNPRFADVPSVPDTGYGDPPIVDMGAYEAPPGVIYVDRDATGAGDGTSWLNAFTNLQDGLDAAEAPAQIWVAAGVYTPTVKYGGNEERNRSFQMANGVAIYGGFDPSVGDDTWGERDWVANPTILSGDIGIEGNPDDNSYHVFYHPDGTGLDSTAILDGFTISGGNANGTDPHNRGGGMRNESSSPTLTNCTFSGNSASVDGGGMYNWYHSSPTLANCTFDDNSARWGGGMYNNDNASPALINCTFDHNSAGDSGGGMFNTWDSSPTLTNSTFHGNEATGSGGGIYNYISWPTLTNCILWGDTAGEIYAVNSSPVVTYSDIQGEGIYPGTGNINADPLFVDPDNGDLHLGPGSPCIDAGSNATPNLPPYDFEGDPRIIDGDSDGDPVVDMGVDEAPARVYLPLVLKNH